MKLKLAFFLPSLLLTLLFTANVFASPTNTHLNPRNADHKESAKVIPSDQRESRKLFKRPLLNKRSARQNVQMLEGCERITFKDGQILSVNIISMDDINISYTMCSKKDGEELNSSLSEISKIYAENGDLIYKNSGGVNEGRILTFSIISIVSAVLGLLWPLGLLFGPLAIIFGGLALREIKKNPEVAEGRKLAMGGLISGIVITALTILLLAILFLAFW